MLELASFWKGTSTKSWMHLAGLHPWTTGFPHWGRAAWHCHHGICFHTVHRLHAMMTTVSHLASPIHTWFQLILSCIPLSPLNNTQRKLILASQERKNLYVIDNVQIQREKKKIHISSCWQLTQTPRADYHWFHAEKGTKRNELKWSDL